MEPNTCNITIVSLIWIQLRINVVTKVLKVKKKKENDIFFIFHLPHLRSYDLNKSIAKDKRILGYLRVTFVTLKQCLRARPT